MMQNGGLDRLMQNPNIRQMAERMQSGGGMPDFNELANDPSMREMWVPFAPQLAQRTGADNTRAQQFMGGGAGRGGQ